MKDNQYKIQDFQDLIEKHLEGKITIEEVKKLVNYYESFQETHEWVEELGAESKLESKMLINILETIQIEKPSKVIPLYKKSFFKYVVAASLIAISFGLTYFNNLKSSAQITESNLKEIKPGYHKATLVLANGEQVDLEAHQNEMIKSSTSTQINNKNNTLEYLIVDNSNNDSKKAVGVNTLYVPIGGIYKLILPDGSKVWLNSNSTLKYPEVFNTSERRVTLEGEAYFEVVKNKGEFIVSTEKQDITVLGTEFNVSAYKKDDFFSSTLVEGKIELSSDDTNSVVLSPGQRGYLKFDNFKRVYVSEVDVRNYSTWKDGIFYFENEDLATILKRAGRWYGFETKFENLNDIKDILFTGVVKKDAPVKDLLEMISETSGIGYQVHKRNDKIIIEVKVK
ncbi:FecR protein [Formosa agariphila KMM 3901]|uniref:FecR protein n=1 Tax=Formosa agariphila (strain DSM 15362 / KCTC 12365 / LMG 23005 / KMM 3901 / M-2Alg 35-1) TaxID=1347342 RepID=T2KQB8_FORAG|nr:FecR family protein [Formosa agariphila]CDF80184.1 FecR protein [Formosa agariphila KMM 3901]